MKSFEELMRDNGFGDSEEELKEEITNKETFIRAIHRIFLSRLSKKLNNLFKSGCNSKQLIEAFNLEQKDFMG